MSLLEQLLEAEAMRRYEELKSKGKIEKVMGREKHEVKDKIHC